LNNNDLDQNSAKLSAQKSAVIEEPISYIDNMGILAPGANDDMGILTPACNDSMGISVTDNMGRIIFWDVEVNNGK